MSLKKYKKQVLNSLINNNKCSIQEASKLMEEYKHDFKEYLKEDYKPEVVSLGMVMHFL